MDAAELDAFVREHTTTLALHDGTPVTLRPIAPGDKADLLDGFNRLSDGSRYRRFLTSIGTLDDATLQYLTEVDYRDHFAWVAFADDRPDRPGIGVSRYVRLPAEPDVAEAAVTVVDEFHRRGLGRILLQALVPIALQNGIRRFRGYMLAENRAIVELLRSQGARLQPDYPGVLAMDLDLPAMDAGLSGTTLYEALRAVARGDLAARHPGEGGPGLRSG